MKVAVSAQGNDLGAMVDPRFGRGQGFLVVDTDTMEFTWGWRRLLPAT